MVLHTLWSTTFSSIILGKMFGLSVTVIFLVIGMSFGQECNPFGERIDCGNCMTTQYACTVCLDMWIHNGLLCCRVLWHWPVWVWGRKRLLLEWWNGSKHSALGSSILHIWNRCTISRGVLLLLQGVPWCYRNTTKTCDPEQSRLDCGKNIVFDHIFERRFL